MHACADLPAPHTLSPGTMAVAGLVALAVAMGIGRFAFTPIMPVMESDDGLTVAAAGYLAAANYLGYLVGALCAAQLRTRTAIRGSLVMIAAVTFAMGFTHDLAWELALRFIAGVGSAWVLIHVSAWSLERLTALGRRDLNGAVYAGVGIGIAAAGLVSLGTMQIPLSSDHTWQLFGLLSFAATAPVWWIFRTATTHSHPAARRAATKPRDRDRWRLLLCYGAFGIGYIIPATYLPAMARHDISNPAVFGLAWPVFGAAAALSTWIAARGLRRMDDRRLWALCYLLMLVGVALPALWPGLTAILIAALLVGSTFMVVTMLGLREARRSAGANATGFIAAMTAVFAVGQIVGPLLVSALANVEDGFRILLLATAALLLLAAISLWRSAAARSTVALGP